MVRRELSKIIAFMRENISTKRELGKFSTFTFSVPVIAVYWH